MVIYLSHSCRGKGGDHKEMTAEELMKKWEPTFENINTWEDYLNWIEINMDNFKEDFMKCPDKDKLLNGWNGFNTYQLK